MAGVGGLGEREGEGEGEREGKGEGEVERLGEEVSLISIRTHYFFFFKPINCEPAKHIRLRELGNSQIRGTLSIIG